MHLTVQTEEAAHTHQKERVLTLILLTKECKSDASRQTFLSTLKRTGSSPQALRCT